MGMAYQMEYLVCGEMEDRENLGEAAARLLALREGLNLIHILGDAGKRAQARELAAVIVGASGLLPLVEVVAVLVMGVVGAGGSPGGCEGALCRRESSPDQERGGLEAEPGPAPRPGGGGAAGGGDPGEGPRATRAT